MIRKLRYRLIRWLAPDNPVSLYSYGASTTTWPTTQTMEVKYVFDGVEWRRV